MADSSDPVRYLTLQFLEWLGERPRSYGEVIDAWRTSCPRLPVWEDAMTLGLIERRAGANLREATIAITAQGREALKTKHIPAAAMPIAPLHLKH